MDRLILSFNVLKDTLLLFLKFSSSSPLIDMTIMICSISQHFVYTYCLLYRTSKICQVLAVVRYWKPRTSGDAKTLLGI